MDTERSLSFLAELYERLVPGEERGKVRQNPECFVIVWYIVHYSTSSRDRVVFSRSQEGVTFPSTLLLLFSQRNFYFLMGVKRLWPPPTWSDVPLGQNKCWMSGHVCRRFPGMDQVCKKILSQVYCKSGWELVPKCRWQGWLVLLNLHFCCYSIKVAYV